MRVPDKRAECASAEVMQDVRLVVATAMWTCVSRCEQDAGCVATAAEGDSVTALPMGRIASFYYLKYTTMAFLRQHLGPDMDLKVPFSRCNDTAAASLRQEISRCKAHLQERLICTRKLNHCHCNLLCVLAH